MDFKALLAKAAKKRQKGKKMIDGKKVASKTTIRMKSLKVEGQTELFTEYIFEDGTSKCIHMGTDKSQPKYLKEQEAGIHTLQILEWGDENKSKKWRRRRSLVTQMEKSANDEKSSSCDICASCVLPKELRFVTYNVWFSSRNQEARAKALIKLVLEQDPHIICLQEVTPVFLEILTANPRIQSEFFISDAVGSTLRGSKLQYGVLMCISKKLRLEDWALHVVPSRMNRRILIATLQLAPNEIARIATGHLESMDNVETRKQQLEAGFKLLETPSTAQQKEMQRATTTTITKSCFFLGDFNFDADDTDSKEKKAIPTDFKDVWLEVYPKKTKKESYTVLDMQMRIDQIHYKSTSFVPKSIVRIGREPIGNLKVRDQPDGENTGESSTNSSNQNFGSGVIGHSTLKDDDLERPSDHCGLSVTFDANRNFAGKSAPDK
mmetsp:Transcript_8852/g.14025  ORF Transcript_8852/g.14025 Transcript_8852/m.14025 type:complete len:436 (+) Transcript_8852:80-1387(+)